jgi:hypothetical protein
MVFSVQIKTYKHEKIICIGSASRHGARSNA